jgi:two-component system, sensor histidine kinase ChiS
VNKRLQKITLLTFYLTRETMSDNIYSFNKKDRLKKSIIRVRIDMVTFKNNVFLFIFFFQSALSLNPPILNSNQIHNNIYFTTLTKENGLSQNSIYCIIQDKKGFLWIGTEDGLNRYDGYQFKIFRNNKSDPNSLSYNYVRSIFEDFDGNLWIGTNGGGLNKYDPKTERFKSYLHDPGDDRSISNDRILKIIGNNGQGLWIATYNGLNYLNFNTEKFTVFHKNPDGIDGLSDDLVYSLYKDKNNKLWIGTLNGLCIFDIEKKVFTNGIIQSEEIFHENINSICKDYAGNLWFGTQNGIYRYNENLKRFFHYRSNINEKGSLSCNKSPFIFADGKNNLWIGTIGGGLNKYDYVKDAFFTYLNNPYDPESISDNVILSFYEDRSGIIWIGTENGGLCKIDWNKNKFRKYLMIPNLENSLSNPTVYSICQDSFNNIWMGTKEGLNKIDKTGKYKHYFNDPKNDGSLSNNYILYIFEDSFKDLWIGTLNGLNRYDRNNERFIRYFNDPDDEKTISSNKIITIFEDSKADIWFGSSNGITIYDRKNKTFKRIYNSSQKNKILTGDTIYAICEDNARNVWIGTYEGLNKIDYEMKKVLQYRNKEGDKKSLSNNAVFSIHQDKKGKIWVGTWGGGLNLYDSISDTFTHYNEDDGLINNVIYGILEDSSGNLWMSTNEGISKFLVNQNKFMNFSRSDGLFCNEFNMNAYNKSKDGTFFFGAVNGAVSFDPESIENDRYIPPMALTNLQILNKDIKISEKGPLKFSLNETGTLELLHNQNIFSLEFSALYYSNPLENIYAYMLKGYDKDWIFCKNRRFVTYTNLNPGNYIFQVKGAGKNGVWNEKGTSLKIKIKPPFWKTLWAFFIYLFAVLLIIYCIIRYRINQQEEKYKQKIRSLEIEKLKELNELRTNFFVNFAHETKNPLTVISNYLDSYISTHEFTDELKIIKQNLDKIVNDIINFFDLEKLERKKSFYNHEHAVDLSGFISNKVKFFEGYANSQKISIKYSFEDGLFTMIDPDALGKVMNNLLENAIKYNKPGGGIYIRVFSHDEKKIELHISDSGIGMSEDQLKFIFEPYYQISHQKCNIQGIGMGLNIVRRIIDEISGDIKVESNLEKGTTFKICFKKHILSDKETAIADDVNFRQGFITKNIELREELYANDKKNLLIIEDNLQLLAYLQNTMINRYNVFCAINGIDALNKLEKIPIPDIIISDIMMQNMDGFEFYDKLLTYEQYRIIPFIFLTSKNDKNDRITGLRKGAIDYISKPFDVNELIIKIDSILRFSQALKEKNLTCLREKLNLFLEKNVNMTETVIDNPLTTDKKRSNPYEVTYYKYGISKREIEIISLLQCGFERKEISDRLNISINTVKTHISRLFEKCKVNNKIDLLNIFK